MAGLGAIMMDLGISTAGFKKEMSSATDAAKKSAQDMAGGIDAILKDTERTMKSKASGIAGIYRKQGMDASEAMKKAWEHIERSGISGEKSFKKSIFGMRKSAKSASDGISKSLGGIAKAMLAAFSIKAIVNFGKECLELGSDLAEVQNVVDVTFGSMSESVNEWAKAAMESYGMSEKVAKEYMGQFGAMSKAFGNTEQMAYDQAAALTGLAGDVASFYNMSTDEAFSKLKAVYTGETEGLKSLGVVMTQTALEEYAVQKGIGKTISAMSEQEKVALRLSFVQDKLAGASGDFARTADGWANQTRVLSLRFDALKASIGQGLINILTPVIRLLNQLVAYLQVAADAFSNFTTMLFGDAGGSTSSAVSSMADASGAIAEGLGEGAGAAKAIKKSLAGFDQINTLGGGDSGGGADGSTPSSGVELSTPVIKPTVDASEINDGGFAKKLKDWLETLPKLEFDVDWKGVKNAVLGGLENLWKAVSAWTHCVLSISIMVINDIGLDILIQKLAEVWRSFTNLVKAISEVVAPAFVSFYEIAISPIIKWLGEEFLSGALNTVISLFYDWSAWFTNNSALISEFITWIAGIVAGIWNLIEPLLDSAWSQFRDIFSKISELVQDLFTWVLDNKELVLAALTGICAAFLAYKAGLAISSLIELFKDGTLLATAATTAQTIAQKALNLVMNANPIGIVVTAIVGLVAAFITLWNTSEDFRNFWIGLWDKIKSCAKSVWEFLRDKVFKPIGDAFKSLWNGIKGIINGMLGGIESFINAIISGINVLIRAINSISFDVPDWVPGIGGKTLGFNLSEVGKISLPRLATGGYVAANTPQLAIVGDNKREGEIIAPESKIAEAVAQGFAMVMNKFQTQSTAQNNRPMYVTLKLGEDTFWEGFVDYHNSIVKRTGETPLMV